MNEETLYRPMGTIFITKEIVICERADCHAPTRFAIGVVAGDDSGEEEGRVIDICLSHLESFLGLALAEGLVDDD